MDPCGIPHQCRGCGKAASSVSKLLKCTGCELIAYCSKDCQVKHWKDHKPCCKTIRSIQKDMNEQQKLHSVTSAQRKTMKTSSGNVRRMNLRAEQLAQEARVHKRASRYDRAILLYTMAIELDPYHNGYHHHRGETWLMAVEFFQKKNEISDHHDMYLCCAVMDAQAALDLCPSEGAPFLTIINAKLDGGNIKEAQDYLTLARRVVPEDAYVTACLLKYQNQIATMRNAVLPKLMAILEPKDDYWFAYSNGFHNYGHLPELIVLDLEMERYGKKKTDSAMKWLFSSARENALDLDFGSVFRVPRGPWVTPIPLSIMNDPEATRQGILALLGKVPAAASICVLKFDYRNGKPDPLSLEKAKTYLQIVVEKGKEIPKLYRTGKKLIPDEFLST